MNRLQLTGHLRPEVGKKSSKQLRKQEMVPCVIYGAVDPVHFTLTEKDLGKLVYTGDVFLAELNIDGKEILAVLKDLQFHPVSDRILHADFLQIFEDQSIKIGIPIRLEGFAKGVQQGGKLKLELRLLMVKGLIKDCPDHLVIDVTKLGLGQSIHVREVNFDGLELLDFKNVVIASVKLTRVAKGTGTAAELEAEEGESDAGSEEQAAE